MDWVDYQVCPEYENWLAQTRRNPGKFVTFDDEKYEELEHFPKVRDALFRAREMVDQRGAVRLDIPSANKGIVVVTVHQPAGAMLVEGYDHSAVVRDAEFFVRPGDALAVGQGKRPGGTKQNKTPFSYVRGTLVGVGNEGVESDSDGVPIYYDPQVVHLYVDARNGRPVKGAEEVHFHYEPVEGCFLPEIEGIYIWAKNPVYYRPGEAPGEVLGAHDGKWDWVSETPLLVTGEVSKVVYPRGNPKPVPLDPALYEEVKAQIKSEVRAWPSAYASGLVVQEYKRRGGRYAGERTKSAGLGKWFSEEWVDLSRPRQDGGFEPCGRPSTRMSEAEYRRTYPKCVPKARAESMTKAQRADAVRRKKEAEMRKPSDQKRPVYVRTKE